MLIGKEGFLELLPFIMEKKVGFMLERIRVIKAVCSIGAYLFWVQDVFWLQKQSFQHFNIEVLNFFIIYLNKRKDCNLIL